MTLCGRVLLAMVIAVATACRAASPPGPRGDITLLTIDTLRADHVPLYGYGRDTAPNTTRWFDADPHGPYQPPEPWGERFGHDAPVPITG